MNHRLRNVFPHFLSSVLNSYTQVFFSNNRVFALILILVTFLDPWAGLSGLLAVLFTNSAAYIIGFNRTSIRLGSYGFNSLLAGLGLGVWYQPSLPFFTLLLFTSVMALFITLALEGVLAKYGLPFLSLSFLLTLWMVTLAARQFNALAVSDRGIYDLNDMYAMGGHQMVRLYQWFNEVSIPDSLRIYFRSLGAILFQYHLLPGLLVAAGLLIYSRIAFMLSLLGFYSAFAYYGFIGADFTELSYGYIGFNFILTAIAIGGFFTIPSWYSFLWVVLITPLVSILLTSSVQLFALFQLSVFSLPFNIAVLMFIYVLKLRERFNSKPALVLYQQLSPEKNLYAQLNYAERFGNTAWVPVSLPFFGEWKISQGHSGDLTHKGDWKHAWDFEIDDQEGRTHQGLGEQVTDYYCYGKPVLSPGDGWVEEVIDGVPDNEIGQSNVKHNWGNVVVIRHTDYLYTKLCHLKKHSIKVVKGAYVHAGDLVASCGNSGRSPVPHLHFQVQPYPHIGSTTLEYPLSNYILHKGEDFILKPGGIPGKGDVVMNIETDAAMEEAFRFIPGQKLSFRVRIDSGREETVNWEVQAGFDNRPYILCRNTGAKAYFSYINKVLSFTLFQGDRTSLLWYFYLSAYKVATGFYKGMQITDTYPLDNISSGIMKIIQDFVSPLFIFMKTSYTLRYVKKSDDFTSSSILLESESVFKSGTLRPERTTSSMEISRQGIAKFLVKHKQITIEAVRDEQV